MEAIITSLVVMEGEDREKGKMDVNEDENPWDYNPFIGWSCNATEGKATQILNNPAAFNNETSSIFSWFETIDAPLRNHC